MLPLHETPQQWWTLHKHFGVVTVQALCIYTSRVLCCDIGMVAVLEALLSIARTGCICYSIGVRRNDMMVDMHRFGDTD